MSTSADILVGLIAVLHGGFLILEMFLWTTPVGRRVFGMRREQAQATRVLAANQGLYNGFLAAGLVWGLVDNAHGLAIKTFFLGCVVLAGLFGGFTASRRIIVVQALPAAVALFLMWMA